MLMCLLSVIIPMPSCLSTTHICSNTEVVRPQGIYLHVTYCTSFDPTKIMLVTYEHVLLYTLRAILMYCHLVYVVTVNMFYVV